MMLTAAKTTFSTVKYAPDGTEMVMKRHHDAKEKAAIESEVDAKIPSMDYVFCVDPFEIPNWNLGLLKSELQEHTKLLHGESMFKRLTGENSSPPWKGINGAVEKNTPLDLAPDQRLVCASRAVIPGHRYQLFNSFAEAEVFRRKVYESVGLPLPPVPPVSPPKKVLFKAQGRPIANLQGMMSHTIDSYCVVANTTYPG